MGLLVSVNCNTERQWPRRKLPVPLYRIHNSDGFVAFRWPACIPRSCCFRGLGALTSYLRPLGHVAWKRIRYTAYFAAVILFIHGTLIDQNLNGEHQDFLDGRRY
jgi:hypothetical protein